MKKFYTVYKITNLRSGKVYFGQHVTTNILDDYMGSGTDLVKDQEKYGIHNFKKEIIDVFDNFKDMDYLERKLIFENLSGDTYNLIPGGSGMRSVSLDDETKEKFDSIHASFSNEIELGKFIAYSEKQLYDNYIKKAATSRAHALKLVNVRKRKAGFGRLCEEYFTIKKTIDSPLFDGNRNECLDRMLEIRQTSDTLNEYLDYISIEDMAKYSFNASKIKPLIDVQKLRYVAKDYGIQVGAMIPYSQLKSIIQKMCQDNGIKKAVTRTVLLDWFEVNVNKTINGVRHYEILAEKK